MRITPEMLHKLARDTVDKRTRSDHTLLAVYLHGSLLGEHPLLGNSADIDLFFVHNEEVTIEREIVRLSDDVHLDISHHSHRLYRQPRELRVHPWLGPTVYGCRILYDPQHFMDFAQASVRGQFYRPDNVLQRARQQLEHAREIWLSFTTDQPLPEPEDASRYLRALDHAVNAVAGLSGHPLTERRFLLDFPARAGAVRHPGLSVGLLGLLGGTAVDSERLRSWLPAWREAYLALDDESRPLRLHAARLHYYERAMEAFLASERPMDALWPFWRTWTSIICTLPDMTAHRQEWRAAGETLGLLGTAFSERVAALDAYLDTVEDILETWARENGV